MNIIVCIKQVPETSNVRMDEATGTMVREGVESIVNPLDLYGIETALRLKAEHGGTITVVTMGPASADRALREAISMGCDRGVLVTGRQFAGSDTHATSYALAKVIDTLRPFDLVFAGVRATDGDTGQVGPGTAAFLGVPLATFVRRIEAVEAGRITLERMVEAGSERLRLPLPCLLTVVKEISPPRLPTLRGKQRAREAKLNVIGADALDLDPDLLGLSGSPTRVVKIEKPRVARQGEIVSAEKIGAHQAAEHLVDFLERKNLL